MESSYLFHSWKKLNCNFCDECTIKKERKKPCEKNLLKHTDSMAFDHAIFGVCLWLLVGCHVAAHRQQTLVIVIVAVVIVTATCWSRSSALLDRGSVWWKFAASGRWDADRRRSSHNVGRSCHRQRTDVRQSAFEAATGISLVCQGIHRTQRTLFFVFRTEVYWMWRRQTIFQSYIENQCKQHRHANRAL